MLSESIKTLKALFQGCDPDSGEKLSHDSFIHNPQVVRALSNAIAALNLIRTIKEADAFKMLGDKPEAGVGKKGKKSKTEAQFPVLTGSELVLFESLRKWRSEAAAVESVPAYIIAHDRMLAFIAQSKPTEVNGLLKISGFGQSRVEKYGEQIISVLSVDASQKTEDSRGVGERSDPNTHPRA